MHQSFSRAIYFTLPMIIIVYGSILPPFSNKWAGIVG
jgi:hypothetical protein